ncbi:elongation factor P 5-aminopentanone reductase [Clostridium sardiniense]|uniref:elongation factor P 5-aminopentanone reductase n=1 Tax=Clostridium sardiniense TaxID=29369 RepID=UPI003D33FF9C
MSKLLGKVAIVTGGSRGIGRDIAIELAKNGANVLINYSKDEEGANKTIDIIKEFGGYAIKVKEDIKSFKGAKNVVDAAINKFGAIDIIINNAGISSLGLFMDASEEDIDNLIGVNLKGAMYITRHGIPHMIGRGGNIINISSMWGEVGASCEVIYSASKGGLNLFTKALAKEMAPSNIRVNCIAPGVIDTDMNAFLQGEERKSLEDEIPMGRFGSGSEIAKCVVFLCTDDSSYLTGQIIRIDGGLI